MVSVSRRFDVFKRDLFTCRYCGRTSPNVVLEVDHIVPVCEGGDDDPMNLTTACWDCNRGKRGVSLGEVITGEDPHDRAVLLLEQERQLREYNVVLAGIHKRVDADLRRLVKFWRTETGRDLYGAELTGLENALKKYPAEIVRRAMTSAVRARKTSGLAYVHACLNNWQESARAER